MNTSTPSKKARPKHPRDMNEAELEEAIALNLPKIMGQYDAEFAKGLTQELAPFLRVYFRPEYRGFEEWPTRKNADVPTIFASNHSGMAFPWDAMMMGTGLLEKSDYDITNRMYRTLVAPMLSASRLMSPYLMENAWRRFGGIDATSLNFESMMNQSDSDLLIYPEGVPGIGKGFGKRYQLQPFSTSMIRMALKYDTDINSIFCVNGEYLNPYAYSFPWLNKLFNKMGVPFFFIGILTIPVILFPFVFYGCLPAKLIFVLGKKYKPVDILGKKWEEATIDDIRRVRDEIQTGMQQELSDAVAEYGKRAFRWGEFFSSIIKNWRNLPYTTLIGWPALFTEYERRYQEGDKPPKDVHKGWFKFWRIAIKNPIVLAYFLPVIGWIPIVMKGMKNRTKVKPWEGPKS